MSTERDTHFLGFAKLLYQELSDLNATETIIDENLNEREKQEQLRVIAQRAYDFAKHVLHSFELFDFETETRDDLLDRVPDLTEWPETD